MKSGYEQISQDFIRNANSSTRYKVIVAFSPSLFDLAQFVTNVIGIATETCRIDALKLIKTGQLKHVADPLNTKYWLYSQFQPHVLNNLTHFEWVIGKWTQQQGREWWQVLAQLEIPLIFCTILKPPAEYWQLVAEVPTVRTPSRILFFKPSASKFSFAK